MLSEWNDADDINPPRDRSDYSDPSPLSSPFQIIGFDSDELKTAFYPDAMSFIDVLKCPFTNND